METVTGPDELRDAVDPLLNLIDQGLALDGVAVSDRPTKAAWRLVTDFIPEVRVGGDGPRAPGRIAEFSFEPWFKHVHGAVDQWYRARYGQRLANRSVRATRGVAIVAATPFEIHVPVTSSRVETEGETAWLSFPNRVLPADDVQSWFHADPNWDSYPVDLRDAGLNDARLVSGLLRRISCRLTGADVSDPVARNLLAGIRIHIQSACDLIMREGEEGSYARSQWELQMACESAYKGYLQQRTADFPETHDLFVLHDRAALPETSVSRTSVHELPRWHEAANLRYGLGDHPTIVGIAYWYRLSLTIIAGIVENLNGHDLGDVSILIRMAPWLREEPDAGAEDPGQRPKPVLET